MSLSTHVANVPATIFRALLSAHADGRKRGLLTLVIHDVQSNTPPQTMLPDGSPVADMIVPFESRTLTPIGAKWIGNDLELSFYSPLLATSGKFPANVCLILDETVFGRAAASVPVRFKTESEPPTVASLKDSAAPAPAETILSQSPNDWQDSDLLPEKEAVISWIVREAAGSVFAAAASSALVGVLLRFLT